MPAYKFQGPDGKVHVVQAPDGATPEEAFDFYMHSSGTNGSQTGSNPATAGGGVQSATHAPWQGATLRAVQQFLEKGPAPDNPTVQNLARGTGLAAGALAKGVTGTAGMMSDALVGGANALTGSNIPSPSAQFAGLFPQPQTGTEKLADFAGTAAAGGMGDPISRVLQSQYAVQGNRPPTQKELDVMQARNVGARLSPSQAGNTGFVSNALEHIAGKDQLSAQLDRYNSGQGIPTPSPMQHFANIAQSMRRRTPETMLAYMLGGPHIAAGVAAGPAVREGAQALLSSEAGQRMFVDPQLQQGLIARNPALLRALPAMYQSMFGPSLDQQQ